MLHIHRAEPFTAKQIDGWTEVAMCGCGVRIISNTNGEHWAAVSR